MDTKDAAIFKDLRIMSSRKFMNVEKRKSWWLVVKNKMRMIKATIEVRCVSCFVGPPLIFLTTPATLNLFDKPNNTYKVRHLVMRK